jgi:hypothetical protein
LKLALKFSPIQRVQKHLTPFPDGCDVDKDYMSRQLHF